MTWLEKAEDFWLGLREVYKTTPQKKKKNVFFFEQKEEC